jgi:probable phosphoglycerate mutase
MRKIDIYVFRHGQTFMNVEQKWQGSGVDSLLTEVGKEQARDLGKRVKNKGIYKIYCSPLLRAVQTANIVAEENSIASPVIILKYLRECSFGDMEGKSIEETKRDYASMVEDFMCPTLETWNLKFSNGESKKEAFERMKKALTYIVSQNKYTLYPVGVVCHAGIINALACGFGLSDVSYENCSILHLVYDYDKQRFLQVKD